MCDYTSDYAELLGYQMPTVSVAPDIADLRRALQACVTAATPSYGAWISVLSKTVSVWYSQTFKIWPI